MRIFVYLISGLVFGLGLTVSDMINPARVLGFLDLFGGAWDPTLAFVMGGAMIPMAVAWRLTGGTPLFGDGFPGPPSKIIDSRLIGGSALFGAGWGLVGLCPGPAISAAALGGPGVWVFLAAMLAGMFGERMIPKLIQAAA